MSLGQGVKTDKPKFYYPAVAVYLAKFRVTAGTAADHVVIDIRSLEKLGKDVLDIRASQWRGAAARARQAWATSDPAGRVGERAHDDRAADAKPVFRFITNVPNYPLQPAQPEIEAASRILGYWGLLTDREITSGHLSLESSADDSASSPSPGEPLRGWVERLFRARGYVATVGSKSRTATGQSLSARPIDYRTEINQGRPFVLTTVAGDAETRAVSRLRAILVGVGYLDDTRGSYIIARDPVITEAAFPPRPQDTPAWAQPGVVFCNWDAAAGDIVLTTVRDVTKEEQH